MTQQLDFRISSGLKNIIGKELITDDNIAIFELVKNAYDADAKKVKIVFLNTKEDLSKGKILIIDDGHGMSYDSIVNKWLFVAYSEKKEEASSRESKDYRNRIQRRRAFVGAKGVGRFSCDRLGKQLRLYTKKEDETSVHLLEVPWINFEEDQKKEFQKVKVTYGQVKAPVITEYPTKEFTHGTILEISDLNSSWDEEKLIKLKKYLQRLINPAQIHEGEEFEIILEAKEFKEADERNKKKGDFFIINGPIRNVVFEKLGISTTEIECHIDEAGDKILTKISDKKKFVFSIKEKNEYPALKNIHIRIFYLNPAAKRAFTTQMGIDIVNYGTIFLYKNGFRIHPYGEPGDDWLEIEKKKGQGYARNLGGRELLGRIEILGQQPDFKEVSNREGGIIKNDHYRQLLEFIEDKVLKRLQRYVVEGIAWDSEKKPKTKEEKKTLSLIVIDKLIGRVKDPNKEIDFNPEILDLAKQKEVEKLPEVVKHMGSMLKYVKSPVVRKRVETNLKSMSIAAKRLQQEKKVETKKSQLLTKELQQKEKEVLFLSDNNPGALDTKTIVHTIGIYTFSINELITSVMKKAATITPDELVKKLEQIRLENERIRAMSHIITRANFNMKVSTIRKDVVAYVSQYIREVSSVNDRAIKMRFEGEDVVHVMSFKPLELCILVDNFVNNAKKAEARRMLIRCGKESKVLTIQIMDDGKGVKDSVKEQLFKLGFTTTRGSGIGLHHIKQIAAGMGGKVRFVKNGAEEGYPGACFEVTFDA